MQTAELSHLVDEFYSARTARIEADHHAAALKTREHELRSQIIHAMRDDDVPVIGGHALTVTLIEKSKPTVQDWGALYSYIRDNDAFDLLHRRLTDSAVKLRWEDAEVVPGVVETTIHDLSLSTARPKGAK